MAATAALAIGYATIAAPPETATWRRRGVAGALAVAAVLLGLLVGAVQLVPLQAAVRAGIRANGVSNAWSLHPLGLLETIVPHLFGDFFQAPQLDAVPWIAPLNSGREPFFFSIYLGPAVLGVALLGALAGAQRWWSVFWVMTGAIALLAAFGSYTPFYPFLRDIVPLLRSFRFPVKYVIVSAMAVAALAAAGCDALAADRRARPAPRFSRAAAGAVAATALIGIGAYAAQAAAIYFPQQTAFRLYDLARFVEAPQSIEAAAFLLHAIPPAATRLIAVALGTALLMGISCSTRRHAWIARAALYVMVSADLVTASIGINPTFDVRHFDQPAWTRLAASQPESRFDFAAKAGGIDLTDPEGPKALPRPPGSVAGREPRRVQLRNRPIPGRLAGARDDLVRPRGPLAAQLSARVPPLSARDDRGAGPFPLSHRRALPGAAVRSRRGPSGVRSASLFPQSVPVRLEPECDARTHRERRRSS